MNESFENLFNKDDIHYLLNSILDDRNPIFLQNQRKIMRRSSSLVKSSSLLSSSLSNFN